MFFENFKIAFSQLWDVIETWGFGQKLFLVFPHDFTVSDRPVDWKNRPVDWKFFFEITFSQLWDVIEIWGFCEKLQLVFPHDPR